MRYDIIMPARHEPIEHTADTGFRAFAPTPGELFEECARALFHGMYDVPAGEPMESFAIASAGSSFTELLVAWLSDLLWLAESEHVALGRFRIESITPTEVHSTVSGVELDTVELHGPPVKAVTYHGLEVAGDDGWRATVILDV